MSQKLFILSNASNIKDADVCAVIQRGLIESDSLLYIVGNFNYLNDHVHGGHFSGKLGNITIYVKTTAR